MKITVDSVANLVDIALQGVETSNIGKVIEHNPDNILDIRVNTTSYGVFAIVLTALFRDISNIELGEKK